MYVLAFILKVFIKRSSQLALEMDSAIEGEGKNPV